MAQPDNLSLNDRLIKAAVQLNDKHPFFAYAVLHLNEGGEYEFSETKVPSMGIDAKGHLIINPKWADQFTYQYLMSVLCHETLHLVNGHLLRLGRRIPEIFNLSNDIVINNILVKNGFQLPADGIIPQNNKVELFGGKIVIEDIDQKFEEEIYDELYRKMEKNNMIQKVVASGYGTGKGNGKDMPKGFDSHVYGEGLTKKEQEKIANKWRDILVESTQHARRKGNIPAGMGRLLDKILNPHLAWRALLWRYVQNTIPHDFTWKVPSKRSITTGVYMPHVLKENVDIVVSVDTSGSIDQLELTTFLTEIVSIGRSFYNVKITLLVCDAAIHEVYTLENKNISKILKLKISGGGGTDHNPVGEWVAKNKPHAKCIINFTDGYTSFYPKKLLKGDTIWVLAGHSIAEKDVPFGRVTKIEK